MANWIGTTPTERAKDAWRRISDKPSSIILVRGDTALSAQPVRVEVSTTASEIRGEAGQSAKREVIVFGVRSHPSVANTDIQRGDKFVLNSVQYRVKSVILQTGEIQAVCEELV